MLLCDDFRDIQITIAHASTGLSRRPDAGCAHPLGAEMEGTAHPLPCLEIAATGSRLFAEPDHSDGACAFTRYATGLLVKAMPHDGERLLCLLRFKDHLSAGCVFDLPRVPGRLHIGGDASVQSVMFIDALENSYAGLPHQTCLDGPLF